MRPLPSVLPLIEMVLLATTALVSEMAPLVVTEPVKGIGCPVGRHPDSSGNAWRVAVTVAPESVMEPPSR
jgi:hypothetical protein